MDALSIPGMSVGEAGSVAAAFVVLGVLIRQFVPWRTVQLDADRRFREDLLQRVAKLEALLERKDALHEAERSLDRHALGNVTQCFDSLLLMLETSPEKAAEFIPKIKEMRANQMKAEAEEKAIIRAAIIAAIGRDIDAQEGSKT